MAAVDDLRARSKNSGWWLAVALSAAAVVSPGPPGSIASGIPFAARAQPLFLALASLALFSILFKPQRPVRRTYLVLLTFTVIAKLLLAPVLVTEGWRGTYYWSQGWNPADKRPLKARAFYGAEGVKPYRIDQSVSFTDVTAALNFVNEYPPLEVVRMPLPRHIQLPLLVRWVAYTQSENARVMRPRVTAEGSVAISVNGRKVFAGRNPEAVSFALRLAAGPPQRIEIVYQKPRGSKFQMALEGFDAVVTPSPASRDALARSHVAAAAITIALLVTLILLAATFFNAYGLRELAADLLRAPAKVAALVMLAWFLGAGLQQSIPQRHSTMELNPFDDWVAYEGQARAILETGPLMRLEGRYTEPYFFYPLYSYGLAGAHFLFGEDFATIVLFNYLCLGSMGLLMVALLDGRAVWWAVLAALAALFLLVAFHFSRYASTAFSDNLFAPMVLAALVAAVKAMEKRTALWWILAGVLAALTAATRPSFMIFIPVFGVALLLDRGSAMALRGRLRTTLLFGLGVVIGLAPFTIRNWIISGRFVLLVSAFSTIAHFLFAPGEPVNVPIYEGPPTFLKTLRACIEIVAPRPLHFAWVAVRKVLFVLGYTDVGPPGASSPKYPFMLTSALFAAALILRRIPHAVRVTLISFAVSHIIAVVLGAPWSYGYKTILPLHVAFLAGAVFLAGRPRSVAEQTVHV